MHTCTLACLLANLSKGMLAEHRPARACASRPPCTQPQGPPPPACLWCTLAPPHTRPRARLHSRTPIRLLAPCLHTRAAAHPPMCRTPIYPPISNSSALADGSTTTTHARRQPARLPTRPSTYVGSSPRTSAHMHVSTRGPGRASLHMPPCAPADARAPARRRRYLPTHQPEPLLLPLPLLV